jgi:hypothetical protein
MHIHNTIKNGYDDKSKITKNKKMERKQIPTMNPATPII